MSDFEEAPDPVVLEGELGISTATFQDDDGGWTFELHRVEQITTDGVAILYQSPDKAEVEAFLKGWMEGAKYIAITTKRYKDDGVID